MSDCETPVTPAMSLHPEYPDLRKLGPNRAEAILRARAERGAAERQQRAELWSNGLSRRRFLAGMGAGAAGVVGVATQLVTVRASFAAGAGTGTLVVVFLRGGLDGLSVIVPADDPHLLAARPGIAVPGAALLPLDRGFGLHPALAPLHELWKQGRFTAVPATSTPDISRSHFQAQDYLERGAPTSGTNGGTGGWLDRVLEKLGPGTTFRAVGQGSTLPRSLSGSQPSLSLTNLESFHLAAPEHLHDKTIVALQALYTGLDHPVAADVTRTIESLETAETLTVADYQPAVAYPETDVAKGLLELAHLVKADVGMRVATIDVDGWDMHTWMGTIDDGAVTRRLTELGQALDAFARDLGDRLDDVTVVVMTEFGRRIEQNANAGTDHGHGAAVLLLGGGLAGGTIHGNWQGLAPEVRDQGDVPGSNDYRDLLGEVVSARLGIGPGNLGTVFPGHEVRPIGVMRT